jgi:hypothetical protein
MKIMLKATYLMIAGLFLITCIGFQTEIVAQTNDEVILDPHSRSVLNEFERRAKGYVRVRKSLSSKLPKLSKKATPEQIEAHKTALQKSVQSSGLIGTRGDFFTPAVIDLFTLMIKNEFKGRDLTELRKTVTMAETKGVPLKVNVPYPEDKELLEMPPSLLMVLPRLPDQVRYRFVGRNLLLVDQEHGLIIDFMTNALS